MKRPLRSALSIITATACGALITAGAVLPAEASEQITSTSGERHVDFRSWDSADDFAAGSAAGVRIGADGALTLEPAETVQTSYRDPYAESAADLEYESGTWTSPEHSLGFEASEAIASWNARTDTGTWVQTEMRGKHADGSWTSWYVMGRWTSGMDYAAGDIHRTSVDGQTDADADVYTDTFVAADGREIVGDQVRVTLSRPAASNAEVSVSLVGVMASEVDEPAQVPSATTMRADAILDVPQLSQEIHTGEYPEFDGGGEAWCSPTSSSMVLSYWGRHPDDDELADISAPNGDPQVDWAAMHTYDYAYEGAGNWPFNTAYAASYGLKSYVTRLQDLTDAEKFIRAGIPLVASVAFSKDELPEAGYATNGHLLVIVGFTASGDVVVNDPASASNAAVRRVYPRDRFENVWLNHSGGVVYITRPSDRAIPVADAVTAPSIAGDGRAGTVLTAQGAAWSQPSSTYSYQWLRDGGLIDGASDSRYEVQTADVGHELSVRVTADDLIAPSQVSGSISASASLPEELTPGGGPNTGHESTGPSGQNENDQAEPTAEDPDHLANTGQPRAPWLIAGLLAAALTLVGAAVLLSTVTRRRASL